MDKKEELRGIDGKPYCGGCKYFKFSPEETNSHYLLDETTAQGECVYFDDMKIGTNNYSKGCRHWTLKKPHIQEIEEENKKLKQKLNII